MALSNPDPDVLSNAILSPSERRIGRAPIWTGRVLSGLTSAFLLFDGAMKLVKPEVVVKTTVELGYPESSIVGIGVVLLVSTLLYVIPRTAFIGAVLLTGYLGGAVATQVRVGAIAFNIIFPAIFGFLVWTGLWLRNGRIRRAAQFK